MDLLKKFWPHAFKTNDVASLVIMIIIYLVAGLVVSCLLGIVSWIFAWLPPIGMLLGLVGGLADLYCLAGIVFAVLKFCKIF